MNGGSKQFSGWYMLILLLVTGCGTSRSIPPDTVARPPSGLPDHFVFDAAGLERDSIAGMKCYSPLMDLRDRTHLVLVRSAKGRGDYAVPDGHYGVGPNDLLRVDCRSMGVIGIVPR
jgi:hypothetical protein